MSIRVAYTVEQCWHDAPGGTAVAALAIARELRGRDEVELIQVAGKHAAPPPPEFRPVGEVAMLPLGRRALYEGWTRLNWPKVEAVTGSVDVAHATGLVPCGTAAPLVVSLHDLAFVHTPEKFTRHGARLMRRSLDVIRRRAARIIVPSTTTWRDCVAAGIDESRLRLVTLGVDPAPATRAEIEETRGAFDLPDRFVLFVGTIEPRKNLRRLAAAVATAEARLPLVVAGAAGWGDVGLDAGVARAADIRFVGFVSAPRLRGLYASASVFAYPSEHEGFGLPVAEAMAQGAPVVTSAGTSTEEVAGGAAVLVDPLDVGSIAAGIDAAVRARDDLVERGRARARELSWSASADATLEVYRELAS